MSESSQAVEDFWRRHQEFAHQLATGMKLDGTKAPEELEIDVDDLIGAKGEKLEPTPEMLVGLGPDPRHPEAPELTPNSIVVVRGRPDSFPHDPDNAELDGPPADDHVDWGSREHLQEVTARIAGRMVTRKAGVLVEPLMQAASELREPLRTVAIAHLYNSHSTEEIARSLGTSVETIEFLAELALDQIAARIRVELT
ncbi:MAG TPA: hypothetical protein VHB02_05465 [Acidimicrobiales bacterium]|nr:hypothetical protein [Acidimicrobiales bacterium]